MTDMSGNVRNRVEALGRSGVVGVALLVFALVFFLSALGPAEDRLRELQDEAQATRAVRPAIGRSRAAAMRPASAQQLATFYDYFPASVEAPQILARIHEAAIASRVELPAGEYKVERVGRLLRYRLTFPVRAEYEQIRAFVAQVLQSLPTVALDEIVMRRENVASTGLEARLRFNLYLADGKERGARPVESTKEQNDGR